MAYSPVPTVVTGDLWTASNHNTYIRDNFAAGVPGILEAKGGIAVASGAQAAAELALGSAGDVLMVDPSAPLGVRWAAFASAAGGTIWGEWINTSWNLVAKNIGVYTVNASDWGIPATGVAAILIGILGRWSSTGDWIYLSARKKGSGMDWVIARSRFTNKNNDALGMVSLTGGQFDLVVAGANALSVGAWIYGYIPEG